MTEHLIRSDGQYHAVTVVSDGANWYTVAVNKQLINSATATLTNKDLTSGTNTFPTFNQNTTGSAAKLTTPRTISGVSFDGSANISIRLDQLSNPTADVSMNTHKLTNLDDPVGDQDAATKTYVDSGFISISDLISTVSSAFVGITLTVKYNTGTSSWPTLDAGLSSNADVCWLFQGGDDAHVPPTVSGTATWVRLP